MRVSVVIPTYNRASRLPGAIDSVLAQDVDGIEIIVVDDGSTDETQAVAAAYGHRVRYVRQTNAGAGAARNTGIRHATGEFVAFLDSDDRWHESKLLVQLALFEARPDVGMVFSDFVIENLEGMRQGHGASLWAGRALDFPEMCPFTLERPGAEGSDKWPGGAVGCWAGPMYGQLLTELPILTSSVIVRRGVLDATTWFAEGVVLFEDWEFFARVARRCHVGFVSMPTTVNVGHADPGRVSKCSDLDRAEAYRALIQRVWLADEAFCSDHQDAAASAYGRALLAVAREALLAGQRSMARSALGAWDEMHVVERRGWASVYRACARLSIGRVLLRNILRGRTALGLVTGARSPIGGSVNPAV